MPASALAAASYVFEPTLSLTGNCKTSALDEVPDPGLCPIPPGVPGVDHPSAGFKSPSVTTDTYGDIYVANVAGEEGRIDIFNPAGKFLSEFEDKAGPQSMAVDAKGNLYVFERVPGGERKVRRFPPTVYKPESEEIEYAEAPVVLADESTKPILTLGPETSLDVDRSTGHVYVDNGFSVAVFGSAAEEDKLLEKEAIIGVQSTSIAIDSTHKLIYLSDRIPGASRIRIFNLEPPYSPAGEINGSTTPAGQFKSPEGFLTVDVDDNTGHVFVGDLFSAAKVYEFEEDGAYLATIEHGFQSVPGSEIAVDDGAFSPHPESEAWLFVPSNPAPSLGHVYAFKPKEQGPPIVEEASVSGVSESEAVLEAVVNPNGLPTEYRFEYITRQQFEEEGESFANATVAGEGVLPAGGEGRAVFAGVKGLEPGTSYRFRVVAENEEGEDEGERAFKTFEEPGPSLSCLNESVRVGLSAPLPDCRAYELVTPPSTNGRPPMGMAFTGVYFPSIEASPDGNRVSFLVEGGSLPSEGGAGGFNGDNYLATRGADSWGSAVAGPSGVESKIPNPGSVSPDQTYSFWEDTQLPAVYIHYPDGHSELVGRGSLGDDPRIKARSITEGATHIVFETTNLGGNVAQQLEPNAPPAGTTAVYDRPAEGPTHVVSLLPGNEPQEAGENAEYLGASEDGEGIAFEIGKTIYVRLRNTETFEVAGPGATFAGIAEEGKRVFYVESGDLFAYDTEAEETIPFSESGDVTPVNVATGGTRAYFVSPSKLTSEPNPSGEEAKAGAENLYLSEEGQIRFVAQVTKRDVEGEKRADGLNGGLGLWLEALATGKPAKDSSRATPTGSTLLFESRADLTGFESGGFAQIYRYDFAQNRLDCLSCSPTDAPPSSDASLQSVAEQLGSFAPATSYARIANQSPDGKRAFFQTDERLVLGDSDHQQDVYEWEEDGVGSCGRSAGCVYLITGPRSTSPDFLYAMSRSGNDVFFRTADVLLPRDAENTLSIYDARVDGGFTEPVSKPVCEGEICRPVTPAPSINQGTTSVVGPDGNASQRHCPKGKHLVKRRGKKVCVKKHPKKKHHRVTGTKRKGGSR